MRHLNLREAQGVKSTCATCFHLLLHYQKSAIMFNLLKNHHAPLWSSKSLNRIVLIMRINPYSHANGNAMRFINTHFSIRRNKKNAGA